MPPTVKVLVSKTLVVPLRRLALTSASFSAVPGAATFSLRSESTTESVAMVPVQSACRCCALATLPIMTCMKGTQLMREDTMKVFGQSASAEPL